MKSMLTIEDSPYSLEQQLDRLALESEILSNLSELFSEIVPSLVTKLSESALNFKSHLFEPKLIKELREAYLLVKAKVPFAVYSNYANAWVSVPEGFEGDLLEYVQFLNNINRSVFGEFNTIASNYNMILSAFITNKDHKTSLKDYNSLYKTIQHHRDGLVKQMDHFFSAKSDSTRKPIGQVIRRLNDIEPLYTETCRLIKFYDAENLNQVADTVKKSIDLLTILKNQIESGADNTVSGNASKNIAVGAYELAKYVEFIAVYRYRSNQAITSVGGFLTTLNDIMK